jgi:hypothetical protein
MRRGLVLALMVAAAAPAAYAEAPPRRLLVIGDSLAYDNRAYLRQELARWKIEEDFSFARSAAATAHDLLVRAKTEPLPAVIHVSSGTGDDPSRPERFRRAIRRVMRIAGPQRCVVWANVWRLRLEEPTFEALNFVLGQEDLARANLRAVDWHGMVEGDLEWLVDLVHVNAEGNRARARAVGHAARGCRRDLERAARA